MWRIPFMVTGGRNGKQDEAPAQALIDLSGVVKSYKTPAGEFQALKGIDLKIDAGEFVAVVGKSGSGKSTLSNMITGIDRPSQGEVIVAGTEVHKLRESQIAGWRGRNIGVVFQFFQLLPTLTVVENVMLPMDFCNMYSSRQRKERALHLLEQVDMVEQADKLPTAISGGQQQRVAIARSLANDPAIIVADEPTGNLDSRSSAEILGFLRRSVDEHGQSIVMVTHDPNAAAYADRVLFLSDGKIVDDLADPTADTVLARMRGFEPAGRRS